MNVKEYVKVNVRMIAYTIIALGFALRLCVIGIVNPDFHAIEDITIASNIVSGYGYSMDPALGPSAYKAPAYPYLASALMSICGSYSLLVLALLQACAGFATSFALIRLTRALNLERIGLIAAALFALHPSYIYYPVVMEPTSFTVLCWATWAILMVERRFVLAGMMAGVLALLQPVSIPVILASIIYFGIQSSGIRGSLRQLALGVVAMIVMIVPWTARNYMEFDRFIAIKSPFWMNVYEGCLYENTHSDRYDFVSYTQRHHIEERRHQINDVEMEHEYRDIVVPAIEQRPMLFAEKTIYQAFLFWTIPPRYFNNGSMSFLLIRTIPLTLLTLAFVMGIRRFYRACPPYAIATLCTLVYVTGVYAITHAANIRFKLDVEWLMLMPAACCLLPRTNDSTTQAHSSTNVLEE